MLETLKIRVCAENKKLSSSGLVIETWGNVSARCPDTGYMVIKPSGVSYEGMLPEDMVVVSMEGDVVEGHLQPSSDTQTHLTLYQALPQIQGIVHTHSTFATIWAQMGRDIPVLGTTHADDFYGPIPCSPTLSQREIQGDYEKATGTLVLETLSAHQKRPLSQVQWEETPAILVKQHGPFVWGASPEQAVKKSIVLEEVAKMAWHCLSMGAMAELSPALLEKHFKRKHGSGAYYGQEQP